MENFTARARKIVSLAQSEAIRLKHSYVGTEHVLLGLIQEGSGVAAKVLESTGVDLETIRSAVENVVAPGSNDAPQEGAPKELPRTPKAERVFQTASEQADFMGHTYVGTEHILLALLLEEEGVAAQVLETLGVELSDVRNGIQQLLTGATMAPEGDDDSRSDLNLPDLPSLDTSTGKASQPALSDDDQLCLRGVNEVESLKLLAREAGQMLAQKEEAVAEERFEQAARLRDALSALGDLVSEAREKWPGIPSEDG